LFKLIEQYTFSKDELNNKTKTTELQMQIKQLEQAQSNLSDKAITRDDLIRIVKRICIILLIIVYPLRLIFFTFKWAIKTYRQT
jgi:hypothetical protein